MSRLGKLPIKLNEKIEARIENNFIIIKGPKGELKQKLHPLVNVDIKEGEIKIGINNSENKKEKALGGLFRSLINNLVEGVDKGFEKKLEIHGVGYRASISGKKLTLNVGYSHPVEFLLPDGISGNAEGNVITVSGIDKQLVGEVAAQIRKIRKPEPYKGKGIRYLGEIVRKKAGKTATKGA